MGQALEILWKRVVSPDRKTLPLVPGLALDSGDKGSPPMSHCLHQYQLSPSESRDFQPAPPLSKSLECCKLIFASGSRNEPRFQ
jgi:hypothetical protein